MGEIGKSFGLGWSRLNPIVGTAHELTPSHDPRLQLVRKGGLASATLFSLLQGDQWEVMLMDVAVGMGPGGQPLVMSLLEEEEPELGGQPGAGHCAPCSAKA